MNRIVISTKSRNVVRGIDGDLLRRLQKFFSFSLSMSLFLSLSLSLNISLNISLSFSHSLYLCHIILLSDVVFQAFLEIKLNIHHLPLFCRGLLLFKTILVPTFAMAFLFLLWPPLLISMCFSRESKKQY